MQKHVRSCKVCLQYKVPQVKPAGLMGHERKLSAPMEVIACDLMGPFPRSSGGFCYLVVTVDLFSKYVWVKPLRTATAAAVHKHLLEDVFLKYGVPTTLLCDNAKQFKCDLMDTFSQDYGCSVIYSFFYHAQANPTERVKNYDCIFRERQPQELGQEHPVFC